ncbi:hypothetical protein BaRGS_00020924, partial [Batillaria attramentaria]
HQPTIFFAPRHIRARLPSRSDPAATFVVASPTSEHQHPIKHAAREAEKEKQRSSALQPRELIFNAG